MKLIFKIHGEDAAGHYDFILVHGDTLEEIKDLAIKEVNRRNWVNYWSTEIKEEV